MWQNRFFNFEFINEWTQQFFHEPLNSQVFYMFHTRLFLPSKTKSSALTLYTVESRSKVTSREANWETFSSCHARRLATVYAQSRSIILRVKTFAVQSRLVQSMWNNRKSDVKLSWAMKQNDYQLVQRCT